MKFNKIRLKGLVDVDLPIRGLNPSASYILKGADGLEPPQVNVFITNGKYLGRKVQDRELVVRVGLQPNYAVGERADTLRETLYGLLTPGLVDEVVVQFMQDNVVVALTKGHVRTFEINPFSNEPEVQITIPCFKPYLEAPAVYSVTPAPANVLFPTLENKGTAPTGFKFEIIMGDTRTSWFLKRGTQQMWFFSDWLAGDKLQVNTIAGERYIRKVRGATTTNILDSLTADSVWFELHGGVNSFQASGTNHSFGPFSYTPLFQGI